MILQMPTGLQTILPSYFVTSTSKVSCAQPDGSFTVYSVVRVGRTSSVEPVVLLFVHLPAKAAVSVTASPFLTVRWWRCLVF